LIYKARQSYTATIKLKQSTPKYNKVRVKSFFIGVVGTEGNINGFFFV